MYFNQHCLKGPKHEKIEHEVFIQIKPVRVGDYPIKHLGLVPKSLTHTCLECIKTLVTNISCLGPFNMSPLGPHLSEDGWIEFWTDVTFALEVNRSNHLA
jgi:hypothetical protein